MNSRRKLNSLITLAALACLLAGCRKDQNTPINSDMLNDLAYKAGSYWVYQDSVTGRIDSFVVMPGGWTTKKESSSGRHYKDTYDEYRMVILWYNVTADTVVAQTDRIMLDNHVQWYSKLFDYRYFISWPITEGMSVGDHNYRLSCLGRVTLNIPSQSGIACFFLRQDVLGVDSSNTAVPVQDDFYYNRDIGMVRMVMREPDCNFTFNLLRYKLL